MYGGLSLNKFFKSKSKIHNHQSEKHYNMLAISNSFVLFNNIGYSQFQSLTKVTILV